MIVLRGFSSFSTLWFHLSVHTWKTIYGQCIRLYISNIKTVILYQIWNQISNINWNLIIFFDFTIKFFNEGILSVYYTRNLSFIIPSMYIYSHNSISH